MLGIKPGAAVYGSKNAKPLCHIFWTNAVVPSFKFQNKEKEKKTFGGKNEKNWDDSFVNKQWFSNKKLFSFSDIDIFEISNNTPSF